MSDTGDVPQDPAENNSPSGAAKVSTDQVLNLDPILAAVEDLPELRRRLEKLEGQVRLLVDTHPTGNRGYS